MQQLVGCVSRQGRLCWDLLLRRGRIQHAGWRV